MKPRRPPTRRLARAIATACAAVAAILTGPDTVAQADREATNDTGFVVLGRHAKRVSAWSFDPVRTRLVKRLDFAGARDTPQPLAEGLPDTVLSVETHRGHRAMFLDPARWATRPLPLPHGIHPYGRLGDMFVVWAGGRQFSLDPRTGRTAPIDPEIRCLFDWETVWVVRKFDGSVEVIDNIAGTRAAHQRAPDRLRSRPWISADGRYVAYLDSTAIRGPRLIFFASRMASMVRVLDLQTGGSVSIPIGYFAREYKGVSDRKHDLGIRFTRLDRVRFLSVRKGANWRGNFRSAIKHGEVDVVVVDLPRGNVTRRTATTDDVQTEPTWTIRRRPRRPTGYRAKRLAGQFLARHDLVRKAISPIPLSAAWDADGRRFLAWMCGDGFYSGNTATDTAVRVDAPDIHHPRIVFLP